MASLTLGRIDFHNAEDKIKDLIRYMEDIGSEAFNARFGRRWRQHAIQQVTPQAKSYVDLYIYQAYPQNPDKRRTYKLLKSIKVEAQEGEEEDDLAAIFIYSDPAIATATAGLSKGVMSYAAFFIEPVKFKSFIRPRGRKAPSNYRPRFFSAWQKFMQHYAPLKGQIAIEVTLRDHMPRSLRP